VDIELNLHIDSFKYIKKYDIVVINLYSYTVNKFVNKFHQTLIAFFNKFHQKLIAFFILNNLKSNLNNVYGTIF